MNKKQRDKDLAVARKFHLLKPSWDCILSFNNWPRQDCPNNARFFYFVKLDCGYIKLHVLAVEYKGQLFQCQNVTLWYASSAYQAGLVEQAWFVYFCATYSSQNIHGETKWAWCVAEAYSLLCCSLCSLLCCTHICGKSPSVITQIKAMER